MKQARNDRRDRNAGKTIALSFCSGFAGALLVYLAMTYLPQPRQGGQIVEVTQNSGVAQLGKYETAASPRAASEPDSELLAKATQRLAGARPPAYTESEWNNIKVYQKTNEAVVNITSWKETQIFNWFFEPIPHKDEEIGSGSIIDPKGYILTNNHVVSNASKLLITLYDGSQFEGETAGSDPENDLAIIRFDPKGRKLNTISFVNNDSLEVGQKVLAIGNPYGFERTLTVGIISGLGRPIKNENGLIIQGMIQADASINPGNSGGPLLNSAGRMIGVNSSIYSPTGSSVGLGFAVPVSTVKRVLPDLIRYGEVRRGWIDIQVIALFPQLVRYSRLPVKKGLLVSRVREGSEAAKAGLRGGQRNQVVRSGNRVIYLGGDIITKINDTEVADTADLYSALEPTRPGEIVLLEVLRDGKKRKLRVKLSTRESDS